MLIDLGGSRGEKLLLPHRHVLCYQATVDYQLTGNEKLVPFVFSLEIGYFSKMTICYQF